MNVSLTPKLEAFVRQKVASGLYNNASEVLREALRRWVESEGWGSQESAVTDPAALSATEPAAAAAQAPSTPPATETPSAIPARLAALEGRLRDLGVVSLAWVAPSALVGRSDAEVELLLEVDRSRRFSVVDLASAKSLCEGALGRAVKLHHTETLGAVTRQALEARAVKVF